jgi:serine protease Do
MKPAGFSLVLATVLAGLASVGGASHRAAQPPAVSATTTVFRDIARRENPVVVSVITRSRVRGWGEGSQDFRFFERDPPDFGQRVHLAAGTGFIISNAGDILTNNHVVEGAERIEVSLFGNERKRYRAIRVGSDPLTDSALIRLENPPPNLQAATLGDSGVLESGDWVMAIGNPFELGHSVTVGVVSFPQRPVQVQDGRWQDLIQTDASINLGNSGGPLFNVRGEVVGINVAIVDLDGANAGIGLAVPINVVKALLPQLRTGKVVRGQLGVQLHGGPILEDEASELRLPRASGAIVMIVDGGSAAERAGLRAGDVIVEIDGKAVADTRDLIARTAATAPGTRVTVKIVRDGKEQTHTTTIEQQPLDAVEQEPADGSDADDGLTLGEITMAKAKELAEASEAGGALVVDVAPDSPADDAEFAVGDIIRAVNRRPVHTLDQARRELRRTKPDRPIFVLVSRSGTDVFLKMRKN